MSLVDSHCHIQSILLNNPADLTYQKWQKLALSVPEVIANAQRNDVQQLIVVSCNLEESMLALRLTRDHSNCYPAIGIHPHEADRYIDLSFVHKFREWIENNQQIKAIGECGLDYFYNHSTKVHQQKVFEAQLDLAVSYNLPMIFHVRAALDDFYKLANKYLPKLPAGVLHSYTDSLYNLKKGLDFGLFIGVNGIATFNRDQQLNEVFKAIPLDRLVLETDAPYLTPTPYRGTINEPKYIKTIAQYLSGVYDLSYSQLARQTTINAQQLFNI